MYIYKYKERTDVLGFLCVLYTYIFIFQDLVKQQLIAQFTFVV